MDPHVIARVANDAEKVGRGTSTLDGGFGPALGRPSWLLRARGASSPPFCHDGTERRIQRPKDATQQKSYYSGKKKSHTVKNVVLVDQQLTIQFLSQTHAGSVHDKRIADATPYPLPPGSHLLQDLGFLAFTLQGVIIDMPTRNPEGAI
jgi:hypothetical protein